MKKNMRKKMRKRRNILKKDQESKDSMKWKENITERWKLWKNVIRKKIAYFTKHGITRVPLLNVHMKKMTLKYLKKRTYKKFKTVEKKINVSEADLKKLQRDHKQLKELVKKF